MKSPLNRGGLRNGLIVVGLVWGAATPGTVLAALPLLLLGTALHFWAKGCLRQNREVSQIGPYRYVRHPFYLANALIDASLAIMSGWWLLELTLPVWWLAVYLPVIRGEEAYLLSTFGDGYRDYQRRVPGLIPWRRPLPSSGEGFSWRNPNIATGREIPRAMRILGAPLLFLLGQVLRNPESTAAANLQIGLLLAGVVLVYGLAWAIERSRLRARAVAGLSAPAYDGGQMAGTE